MPTAEREAGWYWVRKLGWGDTLEDWVPAEWRPEHRSWRSAEFSGVPDGEILQGPRLSPPVEHKSPVGELEAWGEEHGQFCRAGGGSYEKTFAYRAWEACLAK